MTITRHQAEILHELGVMKKSEKIWAEIIALTGDQSYILSTPNVLSSKVIATTGVFYPAYNFEELVLMNVGEYEMTIYNDKSLSIVDRKTWKVHEGANATQALCNKLIHDIKSGIVTLAEVNK